MNAKSTSILQYDYRGLSRIISGGQVGADLGALHAARALQVETGGWAPRGWRTELGPNPGLAEFGLVEHFRPEYKYRTEKNIEESDGTLIVASNLSSPGTALTISACSRLNKPFYVLKLSQISSETVFDVVQWIKSDDISVLNVAGNRDKNHCGIHYSAAFSAVSSIIISLKAE